MGKRHRNLFVSLAAATTIAVSATAFAAAPSQIDDVGIKVSYSDLNIHSKAGARVLYVRLKQASEEICGIHVSFPVNETVQN